MAPKGSFSPRTRKVIIERDRAVCIRCGGMASNIHHRMPRGMGGTRNPAASGAANGLCLCGSGTTGCHGWIESHRSFAMLAGWVVPAGRVKGPEDIPVWIRSEGAWFYLQDDGSRVKLPPMKQRELTAVLREAMRESAA